MFVIWLGYSNNFLNTIIMKKLKHLFTALLMLCATAASAHNFVVNGIYYNIIDATNKTVEVTYRGSSYYDWNDRYTGNVLIPEKVTYNGSTYRVVSIGRNAFISCIWLESIQLPNSIEIIGDNAFGGCTGLTSIEIPNSVIEIGRNAISSCYNLTVIEIPNSVTTIKDWAFAGCTALRSIKIPDSVTYIGSGIFDSCSSLENVEIDWNSVTYIGNSLFFGCTSLTSFEIPNTFTSINMSTFSNCSGLTNITIPNSVTSIGIYAFHKCTGLTSITIPNSVTSIEELAFMDCTGLTSITTLIPADKLGMTSYNAFDGIDKTKCVLYVPYGAKEAYAAKGPWREFENIIELERPTIKISINQYGSATYCSPYALDFSEVEGLKAYAATGYNKATQVVTLTRVQTTEAGVGLFLKGEPGEYVVPVIEYSNDYTLNLLVGTLEQTTVNSTAGEMSNYKFTIADGDAAPMFYPFEDNTTFSAGKAYLQIPTAWLPATAQKSLNIRFDEGETTDIDELEGESGEVKTIYDLQGRVVENPTSGIYIIDGKKVLVK